ncbi:MAG: alpha/beta fold hydrolase [Fuerstiella sp.]|nr:alpha/beta fold hydrolase [Fuerstiella sp.]
MELAIHVFSIVVIVPIFERKLPFEVTSVEPLDAVERVSIPASDGQTLRGSLHMPHETPLGVVIFCPEFKGTHWSALDYCQGLLDFGFAILAFDFRGQGDSDLIPGYEPLHWCTDFEVRDVQSVMQFVRSHSALSELPIGLMGVSRGANAALAVAAADDSVECVVADGAFTTDTLMVLYAARWVRYTTPWWFFLPEWHLHISCQLARFVSQFRRSVRHPKLERWLPDLRRRSVLLIAGERDSYVPPESSTRIQKRIGGNSKVMFVPGAKHNSARKANPQDYDKRVVDLFLNMVPLHQHPSEDAIAGRTPRLQPVD